MLVIRWLVMGLHITLHYIDIVGIVVVGMAGGLNANGLNANRSCVLGRNANSRCEPRSPPQRPALTS